eukprot:CAMPEP_0115036684 /NCGR_PEP_ID=MMETSP0216-20121206/42274_1 /TAXON_ID=223996 /ORGANISM="Protocruzia adherens, Strain Boccale" /LENGTH=115 /DNA_ID=CAMNT_0002416569 /DNA_START=268 /DNA_END=615 /DNA_ORIENTATION=+
MLSLSDTIRITLDLLYQKRFEEFMVLTGINPASLRSVLFCTPNGSKEFYVKDLAALRCYGDDGIGDQISDALCLDRYEDGIAALKVLAELKSEQIAERKIGKLSGDHQQGTWRGC